MNIAANDVFSGEQVSAIAKIESLQEEMLNFPAEVQNMPPVKHYFAPGCYAREMLIPKDCLIIGKIHKHSHLNTIAYGNVAVATFDGVKQYVGHNTFTSEPGIKRVVLALEDTLWTTYHPTEETDLEKIEDEVIAKSYDDTSFLESMMKYLQKIKDSGEGL